MAGPKPWKVVRVGLISGAVGGLIPFVLFLLFKCSLLRSVPYPLFLIVCPPLIITFRDWCPTNLQIIKQMVEVTLLNGLIYAVFGAIVSALTLNA